MKLEISDKKMIIFVSIIVVLLAANIYLMMQPKQQQGTESLYKEFAVQTHSSIQQLKAESAQMQSTLVEKPDMNAEERAQLALLKEFYFSMDSDIEWIAGKENAIYWQLVAANNPVVANGLMRKEMAVLVVSNYIFGLNQYAIDDGMSGLLDRNEAGDEAAASLSWLEVRDLLNDDAAQELIQETLVQKADIINESKELMQQYLERRKAAFTQAEKASDAEYVEAFKLLELGYLLEINNLGETG